MFKVPTARAGQRAILRIPIDHIRLNPAQPRRQISQASIAKLADSIRRHGLLSPILVRALEGDEFELIAGERRLRALRALERPFVEAIVLSADAGDGALLALVENIQRESLHYLDEAAACRRILDEQPITQERLAASLSCSPSTLANRLRLLKLPEPVRAELRRGGLSERHARALLRLESAADQLTMARLAAERRMSVKQLETHIDQRLRRRSPAPVPPIVRDNRIIINAVLDTVKSLRRIGVRVDSRVETGSDHIDVIVTIPALKAAPSE